jgi:kynureninase
VTTGQAGESLLGWRAEFPILDHTVYMVSHSLGAMPRGVYGELRAFADAWATRGVRAWGEGWWEMPITVGNMIAGIVNAPAGSVAMVQNVTIGVEAIASSYDWSGARNRIVTTEVDFPSVLYLLDGLGRRGARVHRVPSADGLYFDMQQLLEAIDEETQLVVVSHVLFKSAAIVDIAPIVARAREVGAHVLLDAYQSVGTVPCDVTALDVDYMTGGSVKWLCGGPGAGFVYAKPSLIPTLRPSFVGWQAHETPFTFDPKPITYRNDAGRFLNGTPHIPCLYAAASGYRIIAEVGVENIRARSLKLSQQLFDRADAAGLTINSPREAHRRGATVTLGVPEAQAVAKTLISREFIVDYRPGAGIRVGPHFYNTEDEVDAIVAEIQNILKSGAWKDHRAAAGEVQ